MIARLKNLVSTHRDSIRAYLSMVGGSAGRLVISLVYFIAIANTLSLSEFGLFATASACGIMLSRLMAFGFVSPLYRIATVKTRLLGVYTAGFLGGLVLSMPVIALAGWLAHWLVFSGEMALATFARVLVAEVLCWRIMEIVVIVSYGINRFGIGSWLVVMATALKTVAALLFTWLGDGWLADGSLGDGSLETWSWWYLGGNGLAAIVAIVFFYPRVTLRWKPVLYLRRWADAVTVAGAEMLFYVQSDLDKVLVLSLGGPETAGIYAIIMRLVDLTALPVRALLTLLTQKLMRTSKMLDEFRNRIKLEGMVAAVSTLGLLGMAGFLWVFPNALGRNVAEATPLIGLLVLVPAFRNLIEYHSELLYATGRTMIRVLVLSSLAGMKALLLAYVLGLGVDVAAWVGLMNVLFFILYIQSALFTYMALRSIQKRPI